MAVEQVSKSRRNLMLMLAVFVVPVVLAKLALEQKWFNYGVTNQGVLLEQPLHLSDFGLDEKDFDNKWLMLVSLPQDCQKTCQQALTGINNTYIALGKEMPRVLPVALTNSSSTKQKVEQLNVDKWRLLNSTVDIKNKINVMDLLIVDPLGNVVLTHKPPTSVDELPNFGKSVLADMKKLLKYSRIG